MDNQYTQEDIENALRIGDLAEITKMINQGVDVNRLSLHLRTDILLESMVRKNFSLFELVLEKNFNIHKNNFFYLHHAIRTNDIDFLKKMIEYYKKNKISVKEIDKDKNNLLHTLCLQKYIDKKMVELLMKEKIKWEQKNIFGHTPLHVLLRNHQYIEDFFIDILMKKKQLFFLKDLSNINCIDILKSFSQDKQFMSYTNNQKIVHYIQHLQR
jgi:ankyrin repeat protein